MYGHILMVTPSWNPGGVGGVYNNHSIGVWHNGALKRYASSTRTERRFRSALPSMCGWLDNRP